MTWITSGWYGLIPFMFLFGGFFYLMMWIGELPRFWFGPQTKRIARTLVLAGTMATFIGWTPAMIGVYGDILFARDYPYRNLAESIGTIVLGIGIVVLSIGLIIEWKRMPRVVDSTARKALDTMKEADYGLDDSRLWVGIDPMLNSWGHSYPAGDESVILLHPGSVYGDKVGGLYQTIIHEMSHVYLTQKKHPSHIEKTYEEVYDPIVKRFPKKWQSKIIRVAMYYPGEVFTEDLTFKVLEGSKTTWAKVTLEYFRLRSAIQKSLAISSKRRMWGNALILVRNCYYASEMERHQMPDPTGVAKNANEKLLSSLPPVASSAFDYFHQVFLSLRDNITTGDYEKTLEDYLSKFIALAELRSG